MTQTEKAEPFYPRDDRPLFAFELPHTAMVERFGSAHRASDAHDNEPGPVEYWSFLFPCGLHVFLAYHFYSPPAPSANVYASSPDIDHILEHLTVADHVWWRLDRAEPELYRQRYGSVPGTCTFHRTA